MTHPRFSTSSRVLWADGEEKPLAKANTRLFDEHQSFGGSYTYFLQGITVAKGDTIIRVFYGVHGEMQRNP